ncbi:MAG: hypothetical protein ACYC2O_10490 [Microthrixaceae bacterium]
MSRTPIQQDPRRRQPAPGPAPEHPKLAAALLMIGIVVALVVISLVSVL